MLYAFLDMMASEKGCSQNTLKAYCSDLKQFFEECSVLPADISEKHISAYIEFLHKKHYLPKSQARKISALKEFCKFLFSEKILRKNPMLYVDCPKQEKPLPKFLTPKQIEDLINQAQNHSKNEIKRIGVMISLMFACGLRVSELVSLPVNAVNHDKKEISVYGKGSKERIVPVSQKALKDLNEYASFRDFFVKKGQNDKFLFPSKNSACGHITRDAFFKNLKKLAMTCGLNVSLVSPHTLRHSFATNLLNHDADLRSVQKMLGHESVVTTEIYTHIISDKLIETVQQKHPLKDFKL